MKKFISIIVILALSASLFLVAVSAEEYTNFNLSANCRLYNTAFNVDHINDTVDIANNSSFSYTWEAESVGLNYGTRLAFTLNVNGANNAILVRKDVPFNFYIDNLSLFFEFHNSTGDYSFYWNNPNTSFRITLIYTDGSTEVFTDVQSSFYNYAQYISASLTPSKDVSSIQFYQYISMLNLTELPMNSVWDSIYVFGLPREYLNVSIDTESKESGQLGAIDDSLNNAINGEVEPDKSPADDKVNDVGQQEEQLLQDTAQGRENIVQYITQAISELSAYATAFIALNAIVDGFFYLPIIGPLVVISLALGIFALIVNLAQTASRSDRAFKSKGKGRSS